MGASRNILHEYFNNPDANVKITLLNGNVIQGVIAGYFKGEEANGESYVVCWHVLDITVNSFLGRDAFGYPLGHMVNHDEIKTITFEGQKTITFH